MRFAVNPQYDMKDLPGGSRFKVIFTVTAAAPGGEEVGRAAEKKSNEMRMTTLLAVATLTVGVASAVPVHADKVVKPNPGPAGSWRLIGQTHASHGADHDTIVVKGPYDNFRKIKFKVTDAPLHMHYMLVTYDNGQPDRIDVRQNIPKGGESRVIDLKGVGSAACAGSSSGTTRRAC